MAELSFRADLFIHKTATAKILLFSQQECENNSFTKCTSRHNVAKLKFVLLNFLFVIKSLWLYFTLLILQCRILEWSIFVEKYIYYGLFVRNNKKKMVGTRGPNLIITFPNIHMQNVVTH